MKLIIMYRTARYAENKAKSIRYLDAQKQRAIDLINTFNEGEHIGSIEGNQNTYSLTIR